MNGKQRIILAVFCNYPVFTALHEMQTRSSDENSVCTSVCQTRAMWRNGRKIWPQFYTIRKKNGWWGRPLLLEILGQLAPVGAKSPILNRYSLVTSAVTSSEKSSIITMRVPMSLKWSSYVARGLKNAKQLYSV